MVVSLMFGLQDGSQQTGMCLDRKDALLKVFNLLDKVY